jgi:hypothetical protein
MDMQASTTLDLAMVEKSVHPRTLFHFTPPLRFILMMMKVKRVENKMKMMSEAS